jgi:hypothetical protein
MQMPSPFPGIDPYLERYWGDIHHRFITYACDKLQGTLPADLRARVQERVFVEVPQGPGRSFYPDFRVVERRPRRGDSPAVGGTAAVAEPLCIRVRDEPVTQGFIEIIDLATGRRVVTVIEVLSPVNKTPGAGLTLYGRKQKECEQGGINLAEIDLLRAGGWVLSVSEELVPASHRGPYRVCVHRARGDDSVAEVYRVPFRERLPVIAIPLRETDADATLDLQALIDLCYRNGGYDEDIDYQAEPDPPLEPDDARWADALLRGQGKRGRSAKKSARNARRPRKRKE